MNINEGMRRLAIALGAVGVVFDLVASYVGIEELRDEVASATEFQVLANSQAIKDLRTAFENGRMSLDCFEGEQKPRCRYQQE